MSHQQERGIALISLGFGLRPADRLGLGGLGLLVSVIWAAFTASSKFLD